MAGNNPMTAARLEELAVKCEESLADYRTACNQQDLADLARCAREYAKLTAHLLDQPWHASCQFVPSGDGVNVVYVDGTKHPPHLRYSRGPKQGFFWDIYGEEFSQELAIIALSQAPYPCSVGPICFSIKLNPIKAVEAAEVGK
jgi:hypothetical protein